MTKHLPERQPESEIILYQTEDGQSRIQCRLQGETLWLTQQQMAELFGVDKSRVSRHLKNIYESGELSPEATVAFYATVRREGNRQVDRNLEHYNLDAIISVGYRVNSLRGTQFRIWATGRLREYEKFRRQHLNDPSSVEGHFLKAVKELKQMEESRDPSDKEGSK